MNPYADKERLASVQKLLNKTPYRTIGDMSDQEKADGVKNLLLPVSVFDPDFTLHSGTKILDFGCGIGEQVELFRSQGFDARGVDVLELWGEDFDQFWHVLDEPPAHRSAYLFKIDLHNYKFPFPNNTFDLCFSTSTFEHVFNLREAFEEINRTLKPGGIAFHWFPGPLNFVEGHINVPIVLLCKYKWYLALWAIAGRRSKRQKGLSWRRVLHTNYMSMQYCNYPTKHQLRHIARQAGLELSFVEDSYIKIAQSTRGEVFRRLSRLKLGNLLAPLIFFGLPRVMVWKKVE